MRELLSTHGFTWQAACHCNGYFTEKYRNGAYDVWVRPKSYKFLIRKDGAHITKWSGAGANGDEMIAAIKQHVPKQEPA